ncbi:MAG: signal peptide peptidase SppA [Steroidobacteraceae bacterium]
MRFVGKMLKGIWRALDGLRKVLHLIVLLCLFAILLAVGQTPLPFGPEGAALGVAPSGELVEELTGDPVDRALEEAFGEGRAETRLRDLREVIEAAAEDARISALVLDLDNLQGAGLPQLQELALSLETFRASGKPIYAWGAWYDQRQYYLAALADEVYLDPDGAILVEGFDYFRQYLKGAADKLGADIHVFKVGTHKSAPDTFTRSDMSAENRAEARAWVTTLWEAWKQDVAAARELRPQVLQAYADDAGRGGLREVDGDLAQYALTRSLVDGLKTREQFENLVAEVAGVPEEGYGFESVGWRAYLSVLKSEHALERKGDANVGVVVAAGDILDGEQAPGAVGGETLSALLRELREDDSIRAVVLRIDSPGGSMYASEQIRREVRGLQEAGKPVVASMSSVAASGGYYIAAPADLIVAAPTTITGSIGVFALFPTLERSLGKLGITLDGFGTTELAGAGRLDRNMNPAFAQVLQSSVEHAYRKFVGMVAEERRRDFAEVDGIAQGKVWSGADAHSAGLVDRRGHLDDAIALAAELGELPEDYGVDWVQPELSWSEALALRLEAGTTRTLRGLGVDLPRPAVAVMEPAVRDVENLLLMGREGRPIYWCACRVR